MTNPRLFISANSEELGSTRNAVAAVVSRLGYEPVSQDNWSSGHGELLQWLREQIDSCEGLLQIVGNGFGAEPPNIAADMGHRVSYTQFEYLYAKRNAKKTWVFMAGEHCQRDKAIDQLDLPAARLGIAPGSAEARAHKADRSALQLAYIEQFRADNQLRHHAITDTKLEIAIRDLKDELATLREKEEAWRAQDAEFKAATTQKLVDIAAAQKITSEKIRGHLLETISATLHRDIAEAEAAADWQMRQRLRDVARGAHQGRLSKIEDLVASFADIEGRGNATDVFLEMTRVLAEQGVDAAIAFVTGQRASILQAVRARHHAVHERNRAELQPLLQAAALNSNNGKAKEARALYQDVFEVEPDWPEALHGYFWLLTAQGDREQATSTLTLALREYQNAHQIAQRLTTLDSTNTEWQRDLSVSYDRLGTVALTQGKLDDAARAYGAGLLIGKKLAASDASNKESQRDLSISYNLLGNVAVAQGKLDDAARAFSEYQQICKKLAASDAGNKEWQHDLSISYDKLGTVALTQGNLDDAACAYGDGLLIDKKLAASDASNTVWQRSLSVSYEKLGDVAMDQGKLDDAARAYGDSLLVRKKLAASDAYNTQWQRDLSVSYNRLGTVALTLGKLDDASRAFSECQQICKKLAASDASNTVWQRDLSVCYNRLGDMAMAQGKLDDAARAYGDGLLITKKLAARDASNSGWQSDISFSYSTVGNVAVAQGNLDDAACAYGDCLQIDKKLAASDPSNTQWQRNLSVSYGKLGDVAVAQGKLDDAARAYGAGLLIRKKLAASDASNTHWQRDLYVSHWRLADLAEKQLKPAEALDHWKQAFDILSGIEKRGLHVSPDDRKVLDWLQQKFNSVR